MKLSEVKTILTNSKTIAFQLTDGTFVPNHFHITELGIINKQFIDCGGTIRNEKLINFQLWTANDFNHRLHPKKLLKIIALSEQVLELEDLEVEVEYQLNTIGKFGLEFDGTNFLLTNKQTACLAEDRCGIPNSNPKVPLSVSKKEACCKTGNNCC